MHENPVLLLYNIHSAGLYTRASPTGRRRVYYTGIPQISYGLELLEFTVKNYTVLAKSIENFEYYRKKVDGCIYISN